MLLLFTTSSMLDRKSAVKSVAEFYILYSMGTFNVACKTTVLADFGDHIHCKLNKRSKNIVSLTDPLTYVIISFW